ncbi:MULTISPECIES: tetratricopeptide repeat protein [Nostocales]|uniref:Probable UDP-N-acetylglucosamine--peptide N-acetylglucosaminyltransferase SPINDLY n=3 Tax=Tolypothrix TaxID=111782 RepID=A0A8S9TA47_9CYAN|nr:tetratricopeptide repeat protein [Tolypothrix bouteillei]KAF3888907.1 tetratricopeptide repeat protein [Tolypothrix bouteillei VB521301]
MNTTTVLESELNALIQLAINKYQSGQLDEAESIYRSIYEQLIQNKFENKISKDSLKKLHRVIILNFGDILQTQGKLTEATQVYQQYLKIDQTFADVYNNLGNIFQVQGQLESAKECYEKAIEIKPSLAEAYNNLGIILSEQDKLEDALQVYQQAIKIKPDWVDTYYNLGNLFQERGQLEAAMDSYQKALSIKPDYAPARFGLCMSQLPIIYSSVDELQFRLTQYQQHLQALADYYQLANPEERAATAKVIGYLQPFYLAYQGLNDRPLQQLYGKTICQIMESGYPQWTQPIPIPKIAANEKIRVGFVSGFFRYHSNWKIPIKGWVENLDKSEFELFGYYTGTKQDRETVEAAKAFDKFTQGPLVLEQWAEVIARDRLHILIFPEFGMEPMTVRLGCQRLAPIQMTSWGHPDTSGLPTIDYYLSSDLMEPQDAQDHYSEQLVRLPNLSIYYTPLDLQPLAVSKRDLGIEKDEIMFWCCQALYKYLPQHDDVFPRIAKALGRCKFVFIRRYVSEQVANVFCDRLRQAFENFDLNYQDYCTFVSSMEARKFAGTAAIADIFLDSIGWSGCNSTLEAIAHNVPVVTFPGDLMRGRHTMAILKMMGIEETIAATKEEYVKIAVLLGQDAQYRQYISQQIAENKHKLYNDLKPVRALEDFLFKVLNKPRRFSSQEVAEMFQLAVQHHQANRLAEAKHLYHQVLEKQPEHPETLYSLGIIAQQLGQLQTAEQWLNKASRVQPDSVKTWFSLGNLHFAQQQYSEAAIAYSQALALRPDSLPIYNNLGYALQQQGLFDEAVRYYQKALELKPDFIEAEANLGNALFAQGKLSSDEQTYYAQLNHKLGEIRERAGDLKTAEAYYRQARELAPEEGQYYINLGKIYQQQKDFSQAIAVYREGLKRLNPRYAEAVATYQSPETIPVTPPVTLGEVTVGAYQFPAIPPVANPEQPRPFWSVVIPVYNRIDYLLESLASVLMQWQGEEEMEILVMDNGSTPPLFEMVNSLGRGVIRYYRNPENLGVITNHNIGIALSRGRWIHVLHDDDCVLPGFYSRLQQNLEACPDSVGAAFTGFENINDKGQAIFTQQVYGEYRGIVHQDWLQKIGVSNPLNMPAVVIRRDAHERLGGFSPQLTYTPDWELYKRIASFYDWWYEPGILARYREHSNNITTNLLLTQNQGKDIRHAIEISDSYLPVSDRATITARSRSHYWDYYMKQAVFVLQANDVAGAFQMLHEALIIDSSSVAVAKLFTWLTQNETSLLGNEIASRLISLPLNESGAKV